MRQTFSIRKTIAYTMAKSFNFEAFYDYIEVLYELKPFFEGEAEIKPFNYLDAHVFIRRCVDDQDASTKALHQLHDALFNCNSSHPSFHGVKMDRAMEMRNEITFFIDELDEWRLAISAYYGLSPSLSHNYAFSLLCEMYCDEDEPGYTSMYSQERARIAGAIPPKEHRQIRQWISKIRHSHFSTPCDIGPKPLSRIDKEVEIAREKIKSWDATHGGLSYDVMSAPLGRSQMVSEIINKLGIHP